MVARSKFCSLSSKVCQTEGKGEGMRWRTWTPSGDGQRRAISEYTSTPSYHCCKVAYPCLETGRGRLEPGPWDDRARNIPQGWGDPEAGSWSANAFLRKDKCKCWLNLNPALLGVVILSTFSRPSFKNLLTQPIFRVCNIQLAFSPTQRLLKV